MISSVKSLENTQKINQYKIKQYKYKLKGYPINVKMCKIPNGLVLGTKTKTNIISSSYFNLSSKNKKNLILKQLKNLNNTKTPISRITNDINTNYYSLSITNNKSISINNNLFSNNNSNNYSKISNNSLLTNSTNKSNFQNINRKKNIIKEELGIFCKKNNYSFKFKVCKIKKVLLSDESRNKKNFDKKLNNKNNNDINNKNNNNINHVIQKILIKNENNINNQLTLRTKSNNKYKQKKNKKELKKNYIKSMFKKSLIRGYLSHSYSRKGKNILKGEINDNSCINNSSINRTHRNIKKNLQIYNYLKLHTRNNTTSCNKKIDYLLNNNLYLKNKKKLGFKFINEPLFYKKKSNKTDIINNINFDKIKIKKIQSPKNKIRPNIIKSYKEKKEINYNIKNYHSISDNINNLKNIISKINDNYFKEYNSNENSIYYKNKIFKEIPFPKFNKIKKIVKDGTKARKLSKLIKELKKKNIYNNTNTRRSINNTYKKNSKEEKFYKNCIQLDKDEDELEINLEDFCKEKINLFNIIKKSIKNKSLLGKKYNFLTLKSDKRKHNKKKDFSPEQNTKQSNINRLYNKNSNKKIDINISDNNLNIKKNKIYLKIDSGSGEEIKKNNIKNTLFSENNLKNLSKNNDDKFDDLYSIIKLLDFGSVLLIDKGLFSIENSSYHKYSISFNNYYDKKYLKNLSTFKKVNKKDKGNKIYSNSTRMNTTSYKKNTYNQENNEKIIKGFKLLN